MVLIPGLDPVNCPDHFIPKKNCQSYLRKKENLLGYFS